MLKFRNHYQAPSAPLSHCPRWPLDSQLSCACNALPCKWHQHRLGNNLPPVQGNRTCLMLYIACLYGHLFDVEFYIAARAVFNGIEAVSAQAQCARAVPEQQLCAACGLHGQVLQLRIYAKITHCSFDTFSGLLHPDKARTVRSVETSRSRQVDKVIRNLKACHGSLRNDDVARTGHTLWVTLVTLAFDHPPTEGANVCLISPQNSKDK